PCTTLFRSIRTPMLARWPATIKAGTKTDHISAFWDVLPTLAEVTGAPVPENIDGISFLPTFMGEEQQAHEHLYWEFHEQQGKQAVRKGDWKAIKLNALKPQPDFLLFNVKEDPKESTNLAAEYPDILEELIRLMNSERTEDPEWPFLSE